jgi:MFS family permease
MVTKIVSTHNFKSFLWHAVFLTFAQSFMDVDTVIPAMLIDSGGSSLHVGIMAAIMLGGSSFTQLFFAPYLSNKPYKKKFLLFGINLRVLSLFALGLILFYLKAHHSGSVLWFIFLFITIFSLSGAFANISYIDILGKSINQEKRKAFLSTRQIIAGVVAVVSVFFAKKVLSLSEYPTNYAFMFFIGGTLLLLASGGFWAIKEETASVLKIKNAAGFLKVLKAELKENKRLAYFLGFINTQGIAISLMPFIVLYAKHSFNMQSDETGVFLVHKIIGVVLVSAIVLIVSKKIKYNFLLYFNTILSVTLAIAAIFINDEYLFRYLFVVGGIIYSVYSITMNGVLLEVSGQENRALYAGFAGAGNILPAVFPLIGGLLIGQFGFKPFFLLFIIVVLTSLYFIKKIDCKK